MRASIPLSNHHKVLVHCDHTVDLIPRHRSGRKQLSRGIIELQTESRERSPACDCLPTHYHHIRHNTGIRDLRGPIAWKEYGRCLRVAGSAGRRFGGRRGWSRNRYQSRSAWCTRRYPYWILTRLCAGFPARLRIRLLTWLRTGLCTRLTARLPA